MAHIRQVGKSDRIHHVAHPTHEEKLYQNRVEHPKSSPQIEAKTR